MRAKSFFYTSAGVFVLFAAYTLGARHASAELNASAPGEIVGVVTLTNLGVVAFNRQGQAHMVAPGWPREPRADLPVPVADTKLLDLGLVTATDVGWVWDPGAFQWRSAGRFPGNPIPVNNKTWSGVKEGYRK